MKVDRHPLLVPIVILHAAAMFAWATRAHLHFGSDAYDLGAYESGFYQFARHGRVWNSVEGVPQWSLHFEIGLAWLWLPFRLAPSPLWLFALQSACCAAVAFPIEAIVREATSDRRLALMCAVATILTPQLVLPEIGDFHSIVVCALPMAILAYGVERDRTPHIAWAALALLSLREQMGLAIAAAAIAWVVRHRAPQGDHVRDVDHARIARALTLGVAALSCFFLEVLWLIPAMGHRQFFPYAASYQRLGGRPDAALRFAVRHPLRFLALPFEGARPFYLIGMPSGALVPAALSIRFLDTAWPLFVAAPLLATQLYNDRSDLFRVSSQYGAAVVPLIGAAAALFVSRLFMRSPRLARGLASLWLGWTIVSLLVLLRPYVVGPGCLVDPAFTGSAREAALHRAIELIPPDASVCAQSGVVPHLTHRDSIKAWPDAVEDARFVLLDTDAGTLRQERRTRVRAAAEALRADVRYVIRVNEAGVLLAERVR